MVDTTYDSTTNQTVISKLYGTVSICERIVTATNAPADSGSETGFQAIVFARNDPGTILHNKYYSYDPATWQTSYPTMYTDMFTDLSAATLASEDNIVVLRSSSLMKECFPSGDFCNFLTETLGIETSALNRWKFDVNSTSVGGMVDVYLVAQPNVSAAGRSSKAFYFRAASGTGWNGSAPSGFDVGSLTEKVSATVLNDSDGAVELLNSWWD